MLAPIVDPTFKYADSVFPDEHPHLYASATDLVIEEPCLVINAMTISGIDPLLSLPVSPPPEFGTNLRNKSLGGKITALVLCYGPFLDLHQRCLDSIVRTVPLDQLDLRVAANCVGSDSISYFRTLPVTKIYEYTTNRYKYPIMRDMLYDPAAPITTNYFVWFDDTCYVNHSQWLNALAADVLLQPPSVAMYGIKLYYSFDMQQEDPRTWLEQRPWHNGLYLRNNRGSAAPNGDSSHFCADWFFAMRTDAAYDCDIPDRLLVQKGGAIVIGEQLYQNNYTVKSFNIGKAFVHQPPSKQLPNRKSELLAVPWRT